MRRRKILRETIPAAPVEVRERMVFGHNTNVTLEGTIFHVQTEDRGITTAIIDTTVHCRGRVLHRRTSKYLDLLPLDADRGHPLKIRLDDQHQTVLDELSCGVWKVEALPMPPPRSNVGVSSLRSATTAAAPASPVPTVPVAE